MARTKRKSSENGDRETPAVRPFWSGTLTFGLVSVPVNLYSAVRSVRPGLRMLDDKGNPLERRFYDPESGRNVSWDDIVRGYELDGEFVVMEEEELDALAPEKSRDIDLRRFVPVEQLDPLYFERSYYLAPAGESTKAYRLLAQTMEHTGRAGIATFVMRGIEYLTAIIAEGGILRAETLRFQDEVRTPEEVGLPNPKKAPAAEKRRLVKAIRELTAEELDESEFVDTWTERLEELVARKRKKGEDVVRAPAAEVAEREQVQVIDLLEVLKKSMAEAGRAERKPAERETRKAAKKATAKKMTAKKTASRKATAKKATAGKATAKRATAKKAASKKRRAA